MHFIDTHLHLQAYKSKTAPQILAEAAATGVEKVVCAAITENDWAYIEALCLDYPQQIIPAFGLHPWYLPQALPGWEERLAAVLRRYPQALIGETGLDRLRAPEAERQSRAFEVHVRLSRELGRPLLIHAVKAQDWLETWWKQLPPKFVFHSYSGRREMLAKIIAAGGYVSFSFSILRTAHGAETAAAVPADRLLLETDGPFQGPDKSEVFPSRLPELAAAVAALRREDPEELSARIYQNSLRFINVRN